MSGFIETAMGDLHSNVSFGGGGGGGRGSSGSDRTMAREGAAVGGFLGNVTAGAVTRGNSTARAAGSAAGAYAGWEVGSRIDRDSAARVGRGFAEAVGRGVIGGNFDAAMR